MGMRSLAVVAAALLAGTMLAGSAGAETLQDALVSAYQTNPSLAAQRAALRALDENVPQALAGWRPSVAFTGEAGKNPQTRNLLPNQTLTPTNLDLSITQPIYSPQTGPQVRSAELVVEAGRSQLASAEQQIMLQTVTAYMDVVQNEALVRLNQNNQEVLRRELEATEDQFHVGEVTQTDVSQAESRLAGATADLIEAQGNLTSSRASYQRVVGTAPGTLDLRPPMPKLPGSEADAQDIAEVNNPDLAAARDLEKSSQYDVSSSMAALYPSVALIGDINRNRDQTDVGLEISGESILARVIIPLYQSGSVYSQIRQRKETESQRELLINDTERQVQLAVAQAWEALETARAAIVSNKKQISSTAIALEGVRQEQKVGSRTVLDVLNAEQEALQAKASLVSSQRDEYVAAYTVQQAIGALTAQGLHLPVTYYDPNVHYAHVRNKWFGTSNGDSSDNDK